MVLSLETDVVVLGAARSLGAFESGSEYWVVRAEVGVDGMAICSTSVPDADLR